MRIWNCTARHSGIQIRPKSQFEFVPRDTGKFEFHDFDHLTKSHHHSGFRFAFRRGPFESHLPGNGLCRRLWYWLVFLEKSARKSLNRMPWVWCYAVATISRLHKVTGLFCTIRSLSWGSFAKETYHLKEPTNRSHAISTRIERWGAGVETQKNVRGEIGGWGRVPFNEPYAPSLSTIYDGA